MKFFPDSTLHQLEFDKIKDLLALHCRTEYAKSKALQLRIHTKLAFIETALQQANEFKINLQSGEYFPNDFAINIAREIKLLGIPGASLSGEQFLLIRRLAENTNNIFRWFDVERRSIYTGLTKVIENVYYEKKIKIMIDEIVDEAGAVKDNASEDLARIRMNLYRKRNELKQAKQTELKRSLRNRHTVIGARNVIGLPSDNDHHSHRRHHRTETRYPIQAKIADGERVSGRHVIVA